LRAQPARKRTTETQRHREEKPKVRNECNAKKLGPKQDKWRFGHLRSNLSLRLCVSVVNDSWMSSVLSVSSVVNKPLRIADFSQDRRSLGSGCGWDV
jgi:hypothetical protein